jgi:hypothetical protein
MVAEVKKARNGGHGPAKKSGEPRRRRRSIGGLMVV